MRRDVAKPFVCVAIGGIGRERCNNCNFPTLSGEVPKNFGDVSAELVVVKNGRSGMPAFGSRLSPEQLQAVVDFTRTGLQQR